MKFPHLRLRRNRKADWSRTLVREHTLTTQNLIYPIFVHELDEDSEISAVSGIKRHSISSAVRTAKIAEQKKIPAIVLFPCIDLNLKTSDGIEAINRDNLICRTIKEIKNHVPGIGIVCDVALDPYTTHGHDGILDSNNYVDNDLSVEMLCKQSLILAEAGCDIIAPSDMMDGRIRAIRQALEDNSYHNIQILSYAAKYASHLYDIFRIVVGSNEQLNKANKKQYQMDPANLREAILEAKLDIEEGADIIMVKPASLYLDVVHAISEIIDIPLFVYQVSGEYYMLKLAIEKGGLNADIMYEALLSCRRAGASAIITYAALEMADYLNS